MRRPFGLSRLCSPDSGFFPYACADGEFQSEFCQKCSQLTPTQSVVAMPCGLLLCRPATDNDIGCVDVHRCLACDAASFSGSDDTEDASESGDMDPYSDETAAHDCPARSAPAGWANSSGNNDSKHMAPAAVLSKSPTALRKPLVMERVLSFRDPGVIAPYRSRQTAIDVWEFLRIRELWSQMPILIERTDVDK